MHIFAYFFVCDRIEIYYKLSIKNMTEKGPDIIEQSIS